VPLPDDVADRVHVALREAASQPIPDADEQVVTGSSTITPFPTAAPDRTPMRWLPAAAAVVVLLAGLGYGITRLGQDGSADSTSAAGAGRSAPELNVARNSTGTDYTDRATLSAAVPDLLAGRGAADSAMVQSAPIPSAIAPQQGAKTLATADPLAALRDNKGLAECLLALLPPDDPSVQPLALDYASFRGQPAMIVVLPGGAENKLDVFVVGPGCSRANDSVLFYTSVDKP
jgi:hypothetical protein